MQIYIVIVLLLPFTTAKFYLNKQFVINNYYYKLKQLFIVRIPLNL